MIHDKNSVAAALNAEIATFLATISDQNRPNNWITTAPAEGKWSPLQHLDHLVISIKAINRALRWVPKWVLRWRFGRPNRPGRTYDELVARYRARLQERNFVNNPFASARVTGDQEADLRAAFVKEHEQFIRLFMKWSEKDLDAYLLPHPLLGKLTLREFLFFVSYHVGHHRVLLG